MRPSLLLLLSCQPELDPGKAAVDEPAEVADWTAYNGTFRWYLAGVGADEPGCDLHFEFTGTPTDLLCEDCEYAFVLEMTYDEDASTNAWDCVDEDEADFTWTLGYDADFFGYDIGAMWLFHEYGEYWTQAFYSELDDDTLAFGYNYYSFAYYYDYYIYSYAGTGTVYP